MSRSKPYARICECEIIQVMHRIKGRHVQIVCYLLEQRYPVPASEILKELDINANTFRKDIPEIEDLLGENGLSLVRTRKAGLKITGPPENIENLKGKLSCLGNGTLPRKKRMWYIAQIFLLSDRIPTIEDFCEILDISKPTVVGCIKEVNKWLSTKGIRLLSKAGVGYSLEGKEEDIRDAFIEAFENYSDVEFQKMAETFAGGDFKLGLGILGSIDLGTIGKFIEDVQARIGKRFADRDVLTLAVTIELSVRRIKNGHAVTFETEEERAVLSNPISPIIKSTISTIENQFQVQFADSEVVYFVLKFVSVKTQKIEDTSKLTVGSRFQQIAEEIVHLTNELLGSTISKGDELTSMLAYHLESVLTKVNMGAKMDNSALRGVEKEYPVAYAIAEEAFKKIEGNFRLKMPDEEKGYIALYIAAALEKIRQSRKKRVAVMCPMGIVTSELLRYELMNEMPEVEIVQVGSIRELKEGRLQQAVDLVISTVPIYNVSMPHAIVSLPLQSKDKQMIREMLEIESGTGGTGILDSRLLCPQIDVNSSREVIKLLGNMLVKNGFARDGIVENALSRERRFPTGLNTNIPIAIPHGSSEFAIKKGFAMATLKKPVTFREMGSPDKTLDVRIIIMSTLTGKEEDGKEFYEVLQKLKDYKVVNELLKCCSAQTMQQLLMKQKFCR